MSIGGGGSDVEVKFGGTTSGLDAASTAAANDIRKVGNEAKKAEAPLKGLAGVFAHMKSEFKRGFSEEMARSGQDFTQFGGTAGGVLDGVTTKLQDIKGAMIITGLAAATLGGAIALVKWGGQFGDEAEKLDQMAAKLGMAATEVSRWGNLATTAGMSTDAFAASGQRLERAMFAAANGGKQQIAMFNALNISAQTMKGGLSPVLMDIADKFSKMEDGPKKTAIAMSLMGRAGANMIPILNQGSDAIREQMQMAEDYGANATEAFMQAGLAVDNAMDESTLATKGLKNALFEELAPVIVTVVECFNDMAKSMIQSYREGGIVAIVAGTISTALKVVATVCITVGTGFSQLWSLAKAALSGILGLIYSCSAALGKLLSGDFSGIKAAWSNGMKATGAAVNNELRGALKTGEEYRDRMQKLWGAKALGGTSKPPPAGDGSLGVPGMGRGGGGSKGDNGKAAADAAKRAAEQALKDEIDILNFKQELARDNYEEIMRLEEQKLAKLKAFYGADSREYRRGTEAKTRLELRHAQEVMRIEQDKLNAAARMNQSRTDTENTLREIALQKEQDHFSAMDGMGQVNGQQRIAALERFAAIEADNQRRHEDAIYLIKKTSMDQQLLLPGLEEGERRRLHTELEQLEVDHQGRLAEIRARADAGMARIQDQAAQQTLDRWTRVIDPIQNAFGGFLTSMATRSQTFGQALLAMGDQLMSHIIQLGVQAVGKWIAMELAKTGATTAGAATRTAAEATAATTGTALSAGAALKQIAHKAAVAAAGAYAAIAAIPVVGPFLAPAMAAAALFGVMKLASSIFSAKDGMGEVQNDGDMYQLHKKEMVLPAKYASPLRDMLTGPRTSGLSGMAAVAGEQARTTNETNRGGDSAFHYAPTHNHQNASLSELLRREGGDMRRWFNNQVRNGSLKHKVSVR